MGHAQNRRKSGVCGFRTRIFVFPVVTDFAIK